MHAIQGEVNKLRTVHEAAIELGCSYWQAYKFLQKGELDGVKLPGGRQRAITAESIARLKVKLAEEQK
jgi:predicted site-specific integrase-resolvase